MDYKTKWFSIQQNPNETVITFHPEPHVRFWPPSVLREAPLPRSWKTGGRVVITGSGAVWMYAHAAALVAANGGCVEVRKPQDQASRNVGDASTPRSFSPRDFFVVEDRELGDGQRIVLVKLDIRPAPPVAREQLAEVVKALCHELDKLQGRISIYLTGSGPVEVYAGIASAAVSRGVSRIVCVSPRDGYVNVWPCDEETPEVPSEAIDWIHSLLRPKQGSITLGVVGDPNCGKSVLSRVLYYCAVKANYWSWRFDSDGQSPTPEWYLSLRQVSREQAEQLRKSQKIGWTKEMEETLTAQLRGARDYFDVLIVDLPGGNLKASPPQRIPPGRETLFELVDKFVLVYQYDASPQPWIDALREHQLDTRIIAMIASAHPHQFPTLTLTKTANAIWEGLATGLDRGVDLNTIVSSFHEALLPFWETIVGLHKSHD
ncbi:hypothetical protein [Thermogutta sp.]|uniref:hypothetical protein n=1 Tax=Thermogutta sp. TaxID=1962930 RepID=UPI0032203DA2